MLVCALAVLVCVPAGTTESPDTILEEVQVVGEHPGPAMWKVTREGHTMWIFATLSPLPAKMSWRARQVEDVIRRSGQVLPIRHFNVDTPAASRTDRRRLREATQRKDAMLAEILPADLHARWAAAYRMWHGQDPDAQLSISPGQAALSLHRQALEKSGLSAQHSLMDSLARLIRKHRVPRPRRDYETSVDGKIVAEEMESSRLQATDREVSCLAQTLDWIDQDLPNVKQRAAAWAVGDIAQLRELRQVDSQATCIAAMLERSTTVSAAMAGLYAQAARDMMSDIAAMLRDHETSFAMMNIDELLRDDGLVQRLLAAGYTVEEPGGSVTRTPD